TPGIATARPRRRPRQCRRRGAARTSRLRSGRGDDLERDHVVGRDRPAQPLERQLPDGLARGDLVHRRLYLPRDQDLAVLRLGAEPRADVRDGADRAVVVAPFEADAPERGVALGDPDAEAELVAAGAPF